MSRRPEDFCSDKGNSILDTADFVRKFVGGMISMDDPEHARLRRIVSKGFTPKQLAAVRDSAERIAHELVVEMAPKGEGDFVADAAALFPLRVIMDMLAIPRSQEQFVLQLHEQPPRERRPGVRASTPTPSTTPRSRSAGIVGEVAASRLAEPRDDVMSMLVHADVDGESLTPFELASFFMLLVAAGSETTRNAIAHGLHALTEHPEQRAIWQADVKGVEPTAIEEIIRWSSPLIHMRRTVTRDGVRLGDFVFDEGDKVLLFYASANRDEAVFDDPYQFDVRRAAQRAHRVRRSRAALLSRRALGAARDRRHVRGVVHAPPRHPLGRRAGSPALELHQRGQAAPGGVDPDDVCYRRRRARR